jgi:biotin carboxyl carrier protein
MHIVLRHRQQQLGVEIHAEGDTYRVVADDGEHRVDARYLDESTLLLVLDGRRYRVALARNSRECFVAAAGETYTFLPEIGVPATHSVANIVVPEITAPMPGKVLQVLTHVGDHVTAGDGLLILEAMKMENRLVAEAAGTVAEVRVGAGDMVEGGQVLLVLQYGEDAPARA